MMNNKGLLGIAVFAVMVILVGSVLASLVLDNRDSESIDLPVTIVDNGLNDVIEQDPAVIVRQIQIDENDGEPVVNNVGDIEPDNDDGPVVEWGNLVDVNIGEVEEGEVVIENIVGYCVGTANPIIFVTSNHNYYDLLVEGNDLVIRNFDGTHPSRETVTLECNGVNTDFMLTTCIVVDNGLRDLEFCGE